MEKTRFQLISNNARFMKQANVELSTVEMPTVLNFDLGYKYESCLFTDNDSDVLERYQDLSEAIAGHERYRRKYGLS